MYSTTIAKPTRVSHLGDLLYELVARDLKVRYKRSLIGMGWSLVTPLLQLAVLSFMFKTVIPLEVENYTQFLFTGIIAWTWFQASLHLACSSIVDNRGLVRQPSFPAAILPVVTVASNLVNFLLALVVLAPFALLGANLSWNIMFLPLIMLVEFVVTLSLAYFLAAFHVTFRDTQPIMSVLLMLGFYLSPVFYPSSQVPELYQAWYQLNPLVHIIDGYRNVLFEGAPPHWGALGLVLGVFGVLLIVGFRVFQRASLRFVEEL